MLDDIQNKGSIGFAIAVAGSVSALAHSLMHALFNYLARLTNGRIILWCYAIWYAVNVVNHFDPRPRIWFTSIGLSAIIGTALLISTRSSSKGTTVLDGWQIFRLYLMPFCVSSFAALVKDARYILVFPPSVKENLMGFALIASFMALVVILKRCQRLQTTADAPAKIPGPPTQPGSRVLP